MDILPQKATTTAEKKFSGNGTSSELKVCPMIPPNLHGAVKVVRPFLSDLEKTVGANSEKPWFLSKYGQSQSE